MKLLLILAVAALAGCDDRESYVVTNAMIVLAEKNCVNNGGVQTIQARYLPESCGYKCAVYKEAVSFQCASGLGAIQYTGKTR